MSDNGLFYRMWCDCLTDLKTSSLTNEDFGFLSRLWALVKNQGTSGSITLGDRQTAAFGLLHVSNLDDYAFHLEKIQQSFGENITISPALHVTVPNRYITVTFPKWLKRQGDISTYRVKKYRQKQRNETVERNANVTIGSHLSSISYPLSKSKERGSRGKPKNGLVLFPEFWTAYPKKVGKGAAETAWGKLNQETKEAILKALPDHHWNPDPQFVPNPATWLNQKRWEDDTTLYLSEEIETEEQKWEKIEEMKRRTIAEAQKNSQG